MSELKLKPRKANSLIFQPEPLQVNAALLGEPFGSEGTLKTVPAWFPAERKRVARTQNGQQAIQNGAESLM